MRKLVGIHFITVLMLFFCFALSPLAQEKKEAEELYTVKQGDTLWEISSKFLKDPFLWPKLWQRNPYITNPHWIYPGQPIRLSPVEELKKEEPKKVVVEEKPKEVAREPEVKEVKKPEPPPVEKKPEAKPVEGKPAVFPEVRSAGFFSDIIDYRGMASSWRAKKGRLSWLRAILPILHLKPLNPF